MTFKPIACIAAVAAFASGQSITRLSAASGDPSLRVANPNINVPQNPPPTVLALVNALPGLAFPQPICLRTPPGETKRLFICEKGGLLKVVPDITAATPSASLFLNLNSLHALEKASECGLLGLAFHPDYAVNRQFFVFYSVKSGGLHQRVSRFTTQIGDPNAADPASELILIDQPDDAGNHNGGDMHFGPDGYLYISVGDEGDGNDSLNNSQTITKDLFSGILRIDVDLEGAEIAGGDPAAPNDANVPPHPHAAIPLLGGLPAFEVPVDNPFVHTTRGGGWDGTFNGAPIANLAAVRDEFYAVGLRNPWRMSFDGNDLWCGDVGQIKLEEIDLIVKGGNYGWAFREANINGPKAGAAPANFDALYHTPPVYSYNRSTPDFNGYSVTGGLVYRGTRIGALTGKYIFADYGSGNIWSLEQNEAAPPTVERIAGEGGIVAFGTDPSNGDVLLADIDGSQVLRLISTTPVDDFPQTLTATGLFTDVTDLSPAPGLLPYAVNLPFWSDYAEKSRWFIIPDGTSSFGWNQETPWSLPTGTIWVKHFEMQLNRNAPVGETAVRKRIETRLIVKNPTGVYGVSYRWNEAGTEAVLAQDGGENFVLPVTDAGVPAPQMWHIPSRSECITCHTPQGGYALSFNTRQLNMDHTILGYSGNQLEILRENSFFDGPQPPSPNLLPRHLRPDEIGFSQEARVRSYLDVNCAYCHQAGGPSPATWDGRALLKLSETGLVHGAPTNQGGDPLNQLVVPGDPPHSVLLSRIAATNGFTRMPPLATFVIDETNVALVTAWIASELPARQTFAQWRAEMFGSPDSLDGAPDADPDHDGATNHAEFLAATDPQDGGTALRPQLSLDPITLVFPVPQNRSFHVETSPDLTTWSPWDVPGNQGLPVASDTIVTMPVLSNDPARFFRISLREN